MKLLIAMNAFKGSLSSSRACFLVAQGFKRGFPECDLVEKPLADGGDGTLEVLLEALGGRKETIGVTGPYGEAINAYIGFAGADIAMIESALCSGLALVSSRDLSVFSATSKGIGEAMASAARAGAKRLIVGIGGTATNDGGIGMIQGAGGKVLDGNGRPVAPGIHGLMEAQKIDLAEIRRVFRGIQVTAISDVTNPLTGPQGATYVFGPQKGLSLSQLASVDTAMERYAKALLESTGKDPLNIPGSGAGGGLGAALWSVFDAELLDGAAFVLEKTGCLDMIKEADFVITGEGKVDAQTEKGKAPYAVAKAGYDQSVPVIILGGGLDDSLLKSSSKAYTCLFDTTLRPMDTQSAIQMTEVTLSFVAEQIARLLRAAVLSNPCKRQRSAGGVVIDDSMEGSKEEPKVLMIKDRYGYFALPKGHIDPGETSEQAAVREVKEETGLDCIIVKDLTPQNHRFFTENGVPVEKTVDYYLMRRLSGSLEPQLSEVYGVFWADVRELNAGNTYPGMKEMLLGVFSQLHR